MKWNVSTFWQIVDLLCVMFSLHKPETLIKLNEAYLCLYVEFTDNFNIVGKIPFHILVCWRFLLELGGPAERTSQRPPLGPGRTAAKHLQKTFIYLTQKFNIDIQQLELKVFRRRDPADSEEQTQLVVLK